MKSMVDVSHEFLKPVLHKQAICVDATLGQGKDTDFFLSQNVHKVYGFEIQRDVFESTKERLDDQRTCFYNVGHEHMEEYIHEEVDAIIFNFGYFPQGNHDITTHASSSVSAVRQALKLLKVKGRMALVMYPHESGQEEAKCMEEFLKTQTSIQVQKNTKLIGGSLSIRIINREKKIKIRIIVMIKFKQRYSNRKEGDMHVSNYLYHNNLSIHLVRTSFY